MAIAILDNDVLVYIFDEIYIANRREFEKVMEYLNLRFNEIWLPKEVKREFLKIRRRRDRLRRLMKKYTIIKDCPITISENEITLMLSSQIQRGEADAILQTRKIGDYRRYSNRIKSIFFVSNDRPALQYAENFGINFCPYDTLRIRMREMGVEI